jgi:hypothetical protein
VSQNQKWLLAMSELVLAGLGFGGIAPFYRRVAWAKNSRMRR